MCPSNRGNPTALPSDLPEEILRPIVRLLLTEALVGSGRATRIRNLRVGVSVGGTRSLMLEWEGSSSYTNPPQIRSIAGSAHF